MAIPNSGATFQTHDLHSDWDQASKDVNYDYQNTLRYASVRPANKTLKGVQGCKNKALCCISAATTYLRECFERSIIAVLVNLGMELTPSF